MKPKWSKKQREYIGQFTWTPTTSDEILTMNYCIAWCEAYGKTMKEWMDAGFNNHMYSPIKDKRKMKLLNMQMEMAV